MWFLILYNKVSISYGARGSDMTINTEDLLDSIMESLNRIEYIKAEDIPDIDLYMDQVTTFMGERLKSTLRNAEDDKILTKTMINNYAKNDLLPPPVKKKYTKNHVLLLIFIYYYKGVLSISDIQALLGPLTEKYFGKQEEPNLETIYESLFSCEEELVKVLKQDVLEKFKLAGEICADASVQDDEMAKLFSFISLLSFDVYVKKLLIEKMIDGFSQDMKKEEAKPDKKAEKKQGKE